MTYPDPQVPQQPQYPPDPQQQPGYYQQPAGDYATGAYQAPPTGGFTAPGYGQPAEAPKNFLQSLFDFSFRSFATPTLLQAAYIIALAMIGLTYLVTIIIGFSSWALLGVIFLIMGLPGVILSIIFTRMFLEYLAVMFRIHENVEAIRNK